MGAFEQGALASVRREDLPNDNHFGSVYIWTSEASVGGYETTRCCAGETRAMHKARREGGAYLGP